MESETQHDFENEQQFWDALEEILSQECGSHSEIDDTLRSYLTVTTTTSEYIHDDADVRRCAYNLYFSHLFAQHADYIRRQFVHCLLQEEDAMVLHITATILLVDAREHEETFALLKNEGVFPRLVEMITAPRQDGEEDLHRQLMELLYEMARVQRITNDDLVHVDDGFICLLFDIIEQVSGDVEDPYHYPVIRVLLVLNEQFMVAAHDPVNSSTDAVPLTNKVIKVLSAHGPRYKTFGENIILLLNREDETSLQLLTLKLLYLLFTTPPTYEYFYTNDLHVLVDILIRNLLDLPEEATALRHTYLRVLYPLLEYTQLRNPPHYKQNEVHKLLAVLAGDQVAGGLDGPSFSHFEEVDETTKRLVNRCQAVTWLKDCGMEGQMPGSPNLSDPTPPSPTKAKPPALPMSRKLRRRTASKQSGSDSDFLAPQLDSARQSSLSVAELANQKEKPGVITPSRNPSVKHGLRATILQKRDKPPPPIARRSRLARLKTESKTEFDTESSESPSPAVAHDTQLTHPDVDVGAIVSDSTTAPVSEIKKPPPAPRARRWRGRRTENTVQTPDSASVEPAKKLSVGTPREDHDLYPSNEEKTLSPFNYSDKASAVKSKRMSSVSAALEQAQAQALQDLQNTLERATINEETVDMTSAQSHSAHQPALLTPPSQPPRRGVPGPKIELEKSLIQGSGDDRSQANQSIGRDNYEEEESEDEWN